MTRELCTYESIRYGAGAVLGGVLAASRSLFKGGIDVAAEDVEGSLGRRVVWNAPDFEVCCAWWLSPLPPPGIVMRCFVWLQRGARTLVRRQLFPPSRCP